MAARGIKTAQPRAPKGAIRLPVASWMTEKQKIQYQKAIKGFLWPNERIEVGKMPSPWKDMIYKLWFVQTPWRGEYPLDLKAGVIGYEPDTQLHLMVAPRVFLYESTYQSHGFPLSPEAFKMQQVYVQSSIDKINERLKKEKPLDPLFLDIDYKHGEWKFVRHEGRHRAAAAHWAGIKKVPVIVFIRVGGKFETLGNLSDRQIKSLHKRLKGRWLAIEE